MSKTPPRDEVNAAFYLDDLEGYSTDELTDLENRLEREQAKRNDAPRSNYPTISRKNKREKKQKKRKISIKRVLIMALILIILTQFPSLFGFMNTFKWQTFPSKSEIKGTKGIIIIGLDNNNNNGIYQNGDYPYTDSLTYIAANFNKNKAYALPIYRDTRVVKACSGAEENINRIYGQTDLTCFIDSTAQFLGLPLDYYVLLTMDGVINIVNALGGVELVASDTFCSNYGEDGQEYCFEEGQTYNLQGSQALAYIRYRGDGNGENRANRQIELIFGVRQTCLSNIAKCYALALPSAGSAAQTNVPVTEILEISHIFEKNFDFETLPVITGVNTEIETGWTMYPDEVDKNEKIEKIKREIFLF